MKFFTKKLLRAVASITVLCSTVPANAQVYINDRQVMADNQRGLWLCATLEDNFGQPCKFKVTYTDSISSLIIDGNAISSGDSISLAVVENSTVVPVQATTSQGTAINAGLQFTFLPILEFSGDFNKTEFRTVPFTIVRPDGPDICELAKVRYRGSLTNNNGFVKRGYRVKFVDENDNKLDVKPFSQLREDNNWVLEGGAADYLRVRNYIATQLWNDMVTRPYYSAEQPKALSASRGQLVEVFSNGQYVGVYNMCEPIDRKQMRLTKYNETTLEIHGQLWKADDRSRITLMDTVPPTLPNGNYERYNLFETKYPDIEDVKPTDYTALYELGKLCAYADDEVFAQQIADRLDIPVVIDYYIFCEALLAFDNEGKNVYWACYDRTASEKLTPAIWDVDVSFGQDWKFADMHGTRVGPTSDLMWLFGNHHRFLRRLRNLNVDDFNAKVIQRYRELRQFELTDEALCNRFIEVVEMLKRSGTAAREEARHAPDANLHVNINFDAELQYILNWIPQRMAYLDEYVFVEHRILRGDLNDDGIYDIEDVNIIINMILGLQPSTPIGDINYDSLVDIVDVNEVVNIILGRIDD